MRYALGLAVLAAAYTGVAQLGYALEFAGPVAAIVWLPVGVGIAFLYLGGLRFWPAVVLGDLLANDYGALPLGSALGQTCGNVAEVILAALLLRRLAARDPPLGSARGVAGMLLAIAAGTALSATVGAAALLLGGVIEAGELPDVWRTWWLGDACGALIVVPLVLAWWAPPRRSWLTSRVLEGAVLGTAIAALSEIALRTGRPLTYLVFPSLIWAALRFGQRGATLAVAVVAGLTVSATTALVGPFVAHSTTRTVLNEQLFILVAAISSLYLAAVVAERQAIAERLRASRARLLEASDTERRRLEHNLHDGAQQRLTALMVRLGLAAEQSRRAPELTAELFGSAIDELALALDELRALAHGIRPPVLRELGLAKAVAAVAARSSVAVRVTEAPPMRLDDTAETTAYYVVLEAITNAQKHAGAAVIGVRMRITGRNLHVEVVDDGVGVASVRPGFGLEGLRDRVEALGGRFDVASGDGLGMRVAASIPATVVAGPGGSARERSH